MLTPIGTANRGLRGTLPCRGAGHRVDVGPERYPNGRFAELRDPEGNGIQLWQPMSPE